MTQPIRPTCCTARSSCRASRAAIYGKLRSAIDLAELLRDQGQPDKARELLAPIYGWFSEGFDTPDLRRGSRLLETLG